MKRLLTLLMALGLLTLPAAIGDTTEFKTPKEKFSYALGMEIGSDFRKQALDLNPQTLSKGIADAFAGAKTLLTEDEMRAVLKSAQAELQAKQAALRAEKLQANQKEGEAFLAANKTKEGVITLPDGLQYKILKAGTGKKPDADDTVTCNYRGTFIDGTEFDSSAKHNGPATFTLKGVIKGWAEALQLMPAGSSWRLYVPPHLAYGEHGAGNVIPPNTTLIFDIELLAVSDDKSLGKERDRE